MANRITFTIDTDAPYTEEEKDNLLNNLVDFFKGEDPDVIDGTEEISIVDVNESKDETVQAAAIEYLKKGLVALTFEIRDENDETIFENDFESKLS
jgi:hypothetical protein